MAIPTVNQLALVLMRECGESSTNADLVAQFEAWVQDIFDEIGIQTEWSWLYIISTLATVNGTRLYEVVGALEQAITMRITIDDTPLVQKKRQELADRGFNLELTGKPTWWYIEGYDSINEVFQLGLYPVPSAIYSIEVLGLLQPQELVSSSKLPFPRSFISVLKNGVRAKFREDDKNWTGAQLSRSQYLEARTQLISKNNRKISQASKMQIQDISYSGYDYVRLPPDHFSN